MADITAGTFAGSVPRPHQRRRWRSLTQELAAHGIPTIPHKLVRAHKRAALHDARQGNASWAIPIVKKVALFIPFATVMTAVNWYMRRNPGMLRSTALVAIEAKWQRAPVHDIAPWASFNNVPDRIVERAVRVKELTGAVPEHEWLYLDPFIRFRRWRGFFYETAYVGAWNTGVPELDNL